MNCSLFFFHVELLKEEEMFQLHGFNLYMYMLFIFSDLDLNIFVFVIYNPHPSPSRFHSSALFGRLEFEYCYVVWSIQVAMMCRITD